MRVAWAAYARIGPQNNFTACATSGAASLNPIFHQLNIIKNHHHVIYVIKKSYESKISIKFQSVSHDFRSHPPLNFRPIVARLEGL
jgi:hypothetical protein